ncbi:MAG: hypothetical protein IJY27_07215 [Clostridia bacterium]|nr:hypothetical protein [Clostridia bacterium]
MSNSSGLEIERKYLIERPDETLLAAINGAYKYDIEQIYLPTSPDSDAARIRRRVGKDGVECFYTVKKRVSALTRIEDERRITDETYEALAASAGEHPAVIRKTRWCLPCGEHIAEVDIYPFWHNVAVVEVELGREDERFELPAILHVLREVTGEKKYLNRDMAYELQKNGRVEEPQI